MMPGAIGFQRDSATSAAAEIERIAGVVASPVASGAMRLAAAQIRGDDAGVRRWLINLLDVLAVDLRLAGRTVAVSELTAAVAHLRDSSRNAQASAQILQHAALADILEVASMRASLNEAPRAASAASLAMRVVCDADTLAQAQLIELIEITRGLD